METILLATALVAIPVGYLAWVVLARDPQKHVSVKQNLTRGADQAETVTERSQERVLTRIGRRLTPPGYVRRLDRLLALAGRPASMPLERLLTAKPAMAIASGSLGFFMMSIGDTPLMDLTGLAVVGVGYFIPDLLLISTGQKRQAIIQLELPNTLDQMLISVEAGLGFESALSRAGERGSGPLAEELVRTLQDMQVGRSRREAYLALADRTNVPELKSFVQAVVQADAYGIAISQVLRVQAKVMRVKRRQRAEEKAMKLPVKILFPLLFFIFPVLFIAILGPAVINAIATFGGM
jgi:tight adherence protein C